MENLIHFETFQGISFTLASSLFLYFTISWFNWFFRRIKPKRPTGYSIYRK